MGNITLKTRLQTVGITGTQLYITKPVRYSTIKTPELVQMMSADSGVPRPMALACTEVILQQIKQLLLNGHSVQFGSLGTFSLSASVKSCEDEKDVSAKNFKRWRILFEPTPEMKDAIKRTNLTLDIPEDVQKTIKELLAKKENA